MHVDAPDASRTARRWLVVDVALLVLALALVVVLAVVWRADTPSTAAVGDAETQRASAAQREVTEVASEAAAAFLEVDHRDMDAVVARVMAVAGGDLAEQYAADSDRLVRRVERAEAVVTSSSPVVGVVRLDGDGATVVVAVDSTLRDRDTGDGAEERKHRLRMVLVRDGDTWSVTELEVVR